MFLLRYFHLVILIPFLVTIPSTIGQGQSLGRLSQCGHALSGEVFVKNDREIIIKGFNYDGNGPAAWFHAMKKGITGGVHTTDPSYYYTLPFPGSSCGVVRGKRYSGEEITLILPVSVKELETIGMLCYQYCHNFGHVTVPPNLNVPAAPAGLPVTPKCPPPRYGACTDKNGNRPTKDGGPNCAPVGPGPSPPPTTTTTTTTTTKKTTTTTTPRPTTTTPRTTTPTLRPTSPTSPTVSTTRHPVITKTTTTRRPPVKPRPPPPGPPDPPPQPPLPKPERGMHPQTVLIIVVVICTVALIILGVIGFRVWKRNRIQVEPVEGERTYGFVVEEPNAL